MLFLFSLIFSISLSKLKTIYIIIIIAPRVSHSFSIFKHIYLIFLFSVYEFTSLYEVCKVFITFFFLLNNHRFKLNNMSNK